MRLTSVITTCKKSQGLASGLLSFSSNEVPAPAYRDSTVIRGWPL